MKPSYDVEIGKVTYNGTEIPLKSGGETPSGEWQPNADMKWAKSVCENDVQEGFTYKVLQMISDGYVYTDIVVPSGGAVKTSDGGYYTANAKHTWDDTNARVATNYSNTKLRWLIYYYTSNTSSITLLEYVIYACFDGMKFKTIFSSKYMLEYFDIINEANLDTSYTNITYMFSGCDSLQTIPLLDTSSVTDMSSMFNGCKTLLNIPLLNTSSVTDMSYMFSGDINHLIKIPAFDTSSVTNFNNFAYYCRLLQSLTLDLISTTSISQLVYGCNKLEFLTLTNIKYNLNISSSTKFSQETLEALIDNLADLTGQTAQTFTMGSTNLAKVSQEKKDLATAKNWSLA